MLNTRLLLGMAMVGLATSPACSTKTSLGQDTPCKPNAAQVDRSCNDDPSLTAVAGICQSDGTCSCKSGFVINSTTGRCKTDSSADASANSSSGGSGGTGMGTGGMGGSGSGGHDTGSGGLAGSSDATALGGTGGTAADAPILNADSATGGSGGQNGTGGRSDAAVKEDVSAGGVTGTGGTTVVIGSGGVTETGGSSAKGGSTGPEAGSPDGWRTDGNPAACKYTSSFGSMYVPATFDFAVTLPDGSSQSCSTTILTDGGAAVRPWTSPLTSAITGKLTASTSTTFSIDTCEAGTACSPSVYQFQVTISGLTTLSLPVGRRVTASWWLMSGGWSCGRVLVVKDAASGDASVGAPTAVWFAGSDSTVQQPIAEPFSFTRQRVYCSPSASQGCGGNDVPPDDYAFLFTPPTSDPPLLLETGQTGTLNLTLGSGQVQPITVHVLRAFQTTGCDDYSNWAWWATGQTISGCAADAPVTCREGYMNGSRGVCSQNTVDAVCNNGDWSCPVSAIPASACTVEKCPSTLPSGPCQDGQSFSCSGYVYSYVDVSCTCSGTWSCLM